MKKIIPILFATGLIFIISSCGNESQNSNTVADTSYSNAAGNSTNSEVNNSLDTSRINDTLRRDTIRR